MRSPSKGCHNGEGRRSLLRVRTIRYEYNRYIDQCDVHRSGDRLLSADLPGVGAAIQKWRHGGCVRGDRPVGVWSPGWQPSDKADSGIHYSSFCINAGFSISGRAQVGDRG